MQNVNVLQLIKKKKPRGIAARRRVAKPRMKIVIDKRNPFAIFATLPEELMYDQMNDFIDSNQDKTDLVIMMNYLKSQMPYRLTRAFFVEFSDLNDDILSFFREYKNRPHVQNDIYSSKQFIKNRLPKKAKRLSPQEQQIRQIKPLQIIDPQNLFDTRDSPSQRTQFLFGKGQILSKCELEYQQAPWMHRFTPLFIQGFAIKGQIPGYTTSKNRDNWYNVSMKWYRDACENKRTFIPGKVAYIARTSDGRTRLILETEEMFKASLREWKDIVITKFDPVTLRSFDVARDMLSDNPILPKHYVEPVLASISTTNQLYNEELARSLSRVLVFLTQLITDPQVHHFRVQNEFYKPEDLIRLEYDQTLPEIYRNPSSGSRDDVDKYIEKRRRVIENQFYAQLEHTDPTVRRKSPPQKMFQLLKTDTKLMCPENTRDVVYYEEDGSAYCFERSKIGEAVKSGQDLNPYTGRKFSSDFLKELDRWRSLTPKAVIEEKEDDEVVVMKKRVELAPGLFLKLREEINAIKPLYCSLCNEEIFVPRYKSVKGDQKVIFCKQACFDKFNFHN
jgi:hypothetical protein